jgi:hypothetical protein
VYFAFYEKFPLDNAFIMIPWDWIQNGDQKWVSHVSNRNNSLT